MARPSKLTDEVQKQIVKAIAAGAYGEVAAEAAGIGKTTFYRWLSEGKRRKRGRFREFRDAIKKAQARGEHADLATIRKRAQGGAIIEERTITRKDGTTEKIIRRSQPEWTPIAWIMERRHAERWGRKETRRIAEMEDRLKTLEKNARRNQANGARQPTT